MVSTNSPTLSSSTSSIEDIQKWQTNFTKTFKNYLHINNDLPISIFQLPETITSQKPQSFIPENIGLGPIHHFRLDLFSKQEQLKLITAKTVLKLYNIASTFERTVHERLVELVPVARCSYDVYFDVDDESLAWVFAIDALFVLDVLSKEVDESFKDIIKVENQIPFVILVELVNALNKHTTSDFEELCLSNLVVMFCEKRSPIKLTTLETLHDLDIYSYFHLLDCMYHLIVKQVPINPYLRVNFLLDIQLEDVENTVQMAGGLFPGANALLQPILLVLKLPWDKISILIKKILGENPTMLEIDIPSVSKMSKIGKIEFCSMPGGIHDIQFNEEKPAFYLPVLDLKSDSEVVLRNLMAYEDLMFKKGDILNLDLTEYVDLMCGIVDSLKDVKILREKNIIVGEMGDEEIVKLFNGITKSTEKTDGKMSELKKTIVKVNKYYGNTPRVKVFNIIKKLFLATWKFFAIVFSLLSLVLMVVSGLCQVYDCKGHFGLGNIRLVFAYATGDNKIVDL